MRSIIIITSQAEGPRSPEEARMMSLKSRASMAPTPYGDYSIRVPLCSGSLCVGLPKEQASPPKGAASPGAPRTRNFSPQINPQTHPSNCQCLGSPRLSLGGSGFTEARQKPMQKSNWKPSEKRCEIAPVLSADAKQAACPLALLGTRTACSTCRMETSTFPWEIIQDGIS